MLTIKLRGEEELFTAIVCGAGGAPPVWKLNDIVVELRVSDGPALPGPTVKMMLTVCGPEVPPEGVTVIEPLYVPAARPVGLMPTLSVVGAALAGEDTMSQLPGAGDVANVKFSGALLLVTETVCCAGGCPPL